jgi:outer membrane protein OmpA-like peptidoglycan-associated protein
MKRGSIWLRFAVVGVLALSATFSAFGDDFKGMIVGRTGDAIILKTGDQKLTIALTDDTKVQHPRGLGIRKKDMSAAVLVPGLRVSVTGHFESDKLIADKITFSKDDLEVAQQIEAGMVPTQQAVKANSTDIQANKEQIASNQQDINANRQEIEATNKRFSELSDYDTKATLNVFFASGSTSLSPTDRQKLEDLAHNAVNLSGYIIQVKGYADSSGNPAMNQKLSMERAQEVVAFLLQDCNVPVRHVIAPGAMGQSNPVATNETAQGRSENRRVEIKVLVNRGLSAGQ